MRNFIDIVKRYGTFSSSEVRDILISIVVLTAVFWFAWLDLSIFEAEYAIKLALLVLVLVGLAFFLHEFAHRVVALWMGIQAEYKAWFPGLILGVVIVFFTGAVFLAPGAVEMKLLKTHRLGHYRYRLNHKSMGYIALAGPLANIALAVVFKILAGLFSGATAFFMLGVKMNLLLAIFNMIPLPPLDGSKVFFAMRYVYAFYMVLFLALAALLLFAPLLIAIILSFALAAAAMIYYYFGIDKVVE